MEPRHEPQPPHKDEERGNHPVRGKDSCGE
jgi:hypothetical protein